jgi:magnesium chelatase subunit I
MIPFTGLERYKGNQNLIQCVLMSVLSSYANEPLHLHAEGLRGTGKTTIMRSVRDILPSITRIKGCIYNCDPGNPHCPEHRHLSTEEITAIGWEEIPMPFLEISHSAKVGTVAGSIDLARLTDISNPEAQLLPGLIPQAHRGIIFIDEINRLADTSPEITDILLDVMGNKPGHIQIEEAGLPAVEIEVQVSVWAASNPDEEPGPLEEIRRQLSDRFDLVCFMGRPDSVETVARILADNSYACRVRNTARYSKTKIPVDDSYRQQLLKWANQYQAIYMPDFLRKYIARLYIRYNLASNKWKGAIYSLVLVIIIWQALSWVLKLPIIPSPWAVLINILNIFSSKIQIHLLYSLGRIMGGIALSILLGVPLGFLMGYFEKVDRLLSPLVYFTYPVPKIALLPIIMLLFGLGEASKLIMIVLIVIFQIIITSRDAVKGIPQEIFRSLQSLGANRLQVFKEIIIPASMADVLTATRLALGTAVSILFFTETFGTQYGMGFFIMDAWMRVNYLDMYAGIVILSLMGFLLFTLIDLQEKRISGWR